jgi:hypothetical protein
MEAILARSVPVGASGVVFGLPEPVVIHMVSNEPSVQFPVVAADRTTAAVALDADFDTRWAAWVRRGRIHEQRVRRTFVMWTGAIAVGAAIVYAFLR